MSCFQRGMVVDIIKRENVHQILSQTENHQISTAIAPSLYHQYFIFCCPAHAGRSKISLQATAVETLGRNIQLPQTWVIKPIFCCPAHAGRSKISLQATAVETLGRNIQLPQTWVIKPIFATISFSSDCCAFKNN
uniref:Uncharacterized protein n=1 Tax=Onchocerca volvulus TaxID=6282 RepID=A0A8R1TLR5_ONCVO